MTIQNDSIMMQCEGRSQIRPSFILIHGFPFDNHKSLTLSQKINL